MRSTLSERAFRYGSKPYWSVYSHKRFERLIERLLKLAAAVYERQPKEEKNARLHVFRLHIFVREVDRLVGSVASLAVDDPRVIENFARRDSLLRIRVQHARDQIFCARRHLRPASAAR